MKENKRFHMCVAYKIYDIFLKTPFDLHDSTGFFLLNNNNEGGTHLTERMRTNKFSYVKDFDLDVGKFRNLLIQKNRFIIIMKNYFEDTQTRSASCIDCYKTFVLIWLIIV